MKLLPRHRLYLSLAAGLFCMHVGVASFARPSFPLTIFGDGVPCLLLLLALLSARENFRNASCLLPLFWKLYFAGTRFPVGFDALLVALRFTPAVFSS